jgi:hypothetical protein
MSQRIADASAKVARSFYPLPRMTDNVLLASLEQLTGLSACMLAGAALAPCFVGRASFSTRKSARTSTRFGRGPPGGAIQ